jgi:glutamyl-tRNA synthetase
MWTTRIAPSPTGDMHLGTARTALFNWLAARATGGRFILRIDDTDTDRNSDDAVKVIFDTMDWLNLDYDAVYRQSDRLDRYRDVATWLVDCHLASIADNGAILLKKMHGNMTGMSWHDTIKGDNAFTDNVMNDLNRDIVLIKGDGTPTYHFASVVDDMDMGVNWVIRGIDHFTNTFLHTMIAHALGADLPRYSHLGLITKNKKKMSKRDGVASMLAYRDNGYDPDAMCDYMMRLGWGPTSGKDPKVITRDDALAMFLDGNLRAAPAGFDAMRLDNLNRRHIGRKENAR